MKNLIIITVYLFFSLEFVPVLAPSWDYQKNYANFGPPTLGSIILLIDENVGKCATDKTYVSLVEQCLFLILHHLNLYFKTLEVAPEQRMEMAKFKTEAAQVASDQFFSKIQNSITVSTCVSS